MSNPPKGLLWRRDRIDGVLIRKSVKQINLPIFLICCLSDHAWPGMIRADISRCEIPVHTQRLKARRVVFTREICAPCATTEAKILRTGSI